MPGPAFFETMMGKRFFEGHVPTFLRELKTLNQNLESLIKRKVKVWIVEYTHRHGHDVWVTGSEETAWTSCLSQVMEFLTEIPQESQEMVKKLVKDGKAREAIELFGKCNEEAFTVTPNEVEIKQESQVSTDP